MGSLKKFSSGLLALISCIALSSHATIIINEIDYDQPGADTAEFIELFNTGSVNILLDNYSIELINGFNASVYRSINLSGFNMNANSYFVVCSNASLVANCDFSFTSTTSWLQNGAPDAIALFDGGDLLDSLSYEGILSPFTEGDALTIRDNNTGILSISRIINGADSNNNFQDFAFGCLTPGSANVAGSGNCSVSHVSAVAVPAPATVWLLGAGMLALLGLARRKKAG